MVLTLLPATHFSPDEVISDTKKKKFGIPLPFYVYMMNSRGLVLQANFSQVTPEGYIRSFSQVRFRILIYRFLIKCTSKSIRHCSAVDHQECCSIYKTRKTRGLGCLRRLAQVRFVESNGYSNIRDGTGSSKCHLGLGPSNGPFRSYRVNICVSSYSLYDMTGAPSCSIFGDS